MYSSSLSTKCFILVTSLLAARTHGWNLPDTPMARRPAVHWMGAVTVAAIGTPVAATADDAAVQPIVQIAGDAKKLFTEGRALELQGNMLAAQRLYGKVTQIAPNFVYGWSSLGNTQTAFGDLAAAESSYTKSLELCQELNRALGTSGSSNSCRDEYILYLNRGTIRLNSPKGSTSSTTASSSSASNNNNNNNDPAVRLRQGLDDLVQSNRLRGRPDDVVLQNLARAYELNGQYAAADEQYDLAIRMTANQVNPFWLRAALVKFQLSGAAGGAYDLLKRVENKFPEAPEVKAASAAFLASQGKMVEAQQKFLEIPNRQRLKYVDEQYLTETIAWPPAMRKVLEQITTAVGDRAATI